MKQPSSYHRIEKRTPLVDTTDGGKQWQGYHSAIPRTSNHDRCFIQKKGGGGVQYSDSTGPMESRRVKISHKRAGTDSRGLCGKSLHKKSDKGSCSPKIRQCDDSFSDKENGRNQIHGPVEGHKISMGVLSIEKITITAENLQGAMGDRDRSFCRPAECSGSRLSHLETGSGRSSNRRVLNNMEGAQSVCLSTNLHDRSLYDKIPEGESTDYHYDTSLASSALVQYPPACSWEPGGLAHRRLTKHPGKSGLAGVSNGKLIHFRPLWGT